LRLFRQDSDGSLFPVESRDLETVTNYLVDALNLPAGDVLRPGVAVRVPQFRRVKEVPEPELLNSFFIEDLVAARAAFRDRTAGAALAAFMGTSDEREHEDVKRNATLLAATLAPRRMPPARWPGRGRHPLYLMQQAAVNHATTLLRDVVAKVVADRADRLAEYDDPRSAFTHVTQMATGGAYTHLYKIDDRLRGFEIVVASSNNQAAICAVTPLFRETAKRSDAPAGGLRRERRERR
jgi:hypothetical protein